MGGGGGWLGVLVERLGGWVGVGGCCGRGGGGGEKRIRFPTESHAMSGRPSHSWPTKHL